MGGGICGWLDPSGLETVPKLIETAQCLLDRHEREGALGGELEENMKAIDRIVQDRDHGAMQLAMWAVEAIEAWGAKR